MRSISTTCASQSSRAQTSLPTQLSTLEQSSLPLPRPKAIRVETCDADDSKQPKRHDQPRRNSRLSELPTLEVVLGWFSVIHQDSRVPKAVGSAPVVQCPSDWGPRPGPLGFETVTIETSDSAFEV